LMCEIFSFHRSFYICLSYEPPRQHHKRTRGGASRWRSVDDDVHLGMCTEWRGENGGERERRMIG
jgi:hypothetical protein